MCCTGGFCSIVQLFNCSTESRILLIVNYLKMCDCAIAPSKACFGRIIFGSQMLGVLFGADSTIERLNKNQSSSDEIKFGHPMTVILFGVGSTIEQKSRSNDGIIFGH